MREVRISSSKLRKIIQKNRSQHRGIYEQAMDGYTKAAVGFFEKELKKAKDGKRFQTYFSEPMPEDHTEDYDTVIEMIDLSEDDSVKLSNAEFRQYVKDEWGWKQQFTATSSNYLAQ